MYIRDQSAVFKYLKNAFFIQCLRLWPIKKRPMRINLVTNHSLREPVCHELFIYLYLHAYIHTLETILYFSVAAGPP